MNNHQKIADALFGCVEEGEQLYAILDSAREVGIAMGLQNVEVEHDSLYRGRSEEKLWDVAPYLIRCERDSAFVWWALEQGWGELGHLFDFKSKFRGVAEAFSAVSDGGT